MVETFFTEKRIIKKIIIAIVFIFLFNFTFTYLGNNVVFADEYEDVAEGEVITDEQVEEEEGGGKLLVPIAELLLFLGDSVLQILQNSFLSSSEVTIKAVSDENKDIGSGIFWIALGVVTVVAGVITCGVGVAAVVSAASAATGFVATAGAIATGIAGAAKTVLVGGILITGGVYAGVKGVKDIKGEFDLPTIQYTPEAIFSNRIPLFNINFFNPVADKFETVTETYEVLEMVNKNNPELNVKLTVSEVPKGLDFDNEEEVKKAKEKLKNEAYEVYKVIAALHKSTREAQEEVTVNSELYNELGVMKDSIASAFRTHSFAFHILNSNYQQWEGDPYLTEVKLNQTVNDAFDYDKDLNRINNFVKSFNGALEDSSVGVKDVTNFLEKLKNGDYGDNNEEIVKVINEKFGQYYTADPFNISKTTKTNTDVIETYKSSSGILQGTVSKIYTNLRTVAIVALLTILVYVGIRIVLSSTGKDKAKYKQMIMDWLVAFIMVFVLHYIMAFTIDISEKLTKIAQKSNVENIPLAIPADTTVNINGEKKKLRDQAGITDDKYSSDMTIAWGTNFIGFTRYYAGLIKHKGYTMKSISYLLMYMVQITYLVMFTFQYLKRVLYMAFLTMISPLVAITYPIDKINDGKAQGFNMWIREYIFNALLQPIHYIIYVIIMGSVLDLVIDYPVYSLVALGFMLPAEKFIRKMFGFEKASTVGTFGGAAGAAMLMGGIQKLTHRPHKEKNNNDKDDKDFLNGKVRSTNYLPEDKKGGSLPGGDIAKGAAEEGVKGVGNAIIPGAGTIASGLLNNRQSDMKEGQINIQSDYDFDKYGKGAYLDNGIREGSIDESKLGDIGRENLDYYRGYQASQVQERQQYPTQEQQEKPIPKEGDSNFIGPPRPPKSTQAAPQTTPQTTKNIYNKPRTKREKVKDGLTAVGGYYKRRVDNSIRKAKPLRTLRRGLTYGIGAATLGLVGLAAGIASGDAGKALQYTSAGALAGGNLGKNLGETASGIVGVDGAINAYRRGKLGSEYNNYQKEEYKKELLAKESTYNLARKKGLKEEDVKRMATKGGMIDQAMERGEYDLGNQMNLYKAQQRWLESGKITEEQIQAKADVRVEEERKRKAEQFIDKKGNLTEAEKEKVRKGYVLDPKIEHEIRGNREGLREDVATDLAFAGYKLDSVFGDYSSNSKTRENFDKTLENRGYTGEEQEKVKKGMLNVMDVYQDATLDGGTEGTTVKTPIDYERYANDGDSTSAETTDSSEKEDKTDYRPSPTFTQPIENVPKEDREETARRANAESEANKAQMKQKSEKEAMSEEIEKIKKGQVNTKQRESINKAKERRAKVKEKNNVENGEQKEQVQEFESKRKKSPKIRQSTFDLNDNPKTSPVSSDTEKTNIDPIYTPPNK